MHTGDRMHNISLIIIGGITFMTSQLNSDS